jgi:hypothetical protein
MIFDPLNHNDFVWETVSLLVYPTLTFFLDGFLGTVVVSLCNPETLLRADHPSVEFQQDLGAVATHSDKSTRWLRPDLQTADNWTLGVDELLQQLTENLNVKVEDELSNKQLDRRELIW